MSSTASKTLRLFVLLGLIPAIAGAASTVQFQKDATKIALPHVQALKFTPNSGPAKIHILFAAKLPVDVTLSDAFGDAGFSLGNWTKSSGSAAVKFEFAESDMENFSLNTFNTGGADMALGGHQSGDGIQGIFKSVAIKDGKISGVIQYDGPGGKVTGKFDTPLATVSEPAVIKGSAVGKSEPAKALLSFVRALTKFDFATAETFSASPIVDDLNDLRKRQGDAAFKEMLKEEFGDPKELEKLLNASDAQLAEGADSAKVWVKRPGHESLSRFGLIKKNGKWGVNW